MQMQKRYEAEECKKKKKQYNFYKFLFNKIFCFLIVQWIYVNFS